MDGITYGVIYSIVSVMSFDLKLLPMEELWTDGYEGVDPNSGTARWRQSGPGTVEWTNSAFESKRVYQVDSSGRILSSDYNFLDTVARIKTEYRYAETRLERIVWRLDGKLTDQEVFTWSGGELARYAWIDEGSKDTSRWDFIRSEGHIDTIRFTKGTYSSFTSYAYPAPDSILRIVHRSGGEVRTGFRLKDGHVVYGDGPDFFKWGAEAGIRPRPSARAGMRRVEGRDWLGRKPGPQKYISRSTPNLVPNLK